MRRGSPEPAELDLLVVGEDPLARSGLALMLQAEAPELSIRQAPRDAHVLDAERADVWVWDLEGGDGGMPLLERFTRQQQRVVALGTRDERLLEALTAGAGAALVRTQTAPGLMAAIRAVVHGLTVVDPELATRLVQQGDEAEEVAAPIREPLTARENEVLALLATGASNREVAAALGISEHTAKFHVNSVLAKLGVQRRLDAVVRAARLGIIHL